MNNFGGLFGFVIDKICDLVLASNGIDLPAAPKDDSYPKHKDRAPYPPDDPKKVPPSENVKLAAVKRQAADKEFWETL